VAGPDEVHQLLMLFAGQSAGLIALGQVLHAGLVFLAETERQDVAGEVAGHLAFAVTQDTAEDVGLAGPGCGDLCWMHGLRLLVLILPRICNDTEGRGGTLEKRCKIFMGSLRRPPARGRRRSPRTR